MAELVSVCVGCEGRDEGGKSVSNRCFIITHNICPRSELSFLGSELCLKQALFSLLESSGLGGLGWQKIHKSSIQCSKINVNNDVQLVEQNFSSAPSKLECFPFWCWLMEELEEPQSLQVIVMV